MQARRSPGVGSQASRRARGLVAAVVVALALAACASGGSTASGGGTSAEGPAQVLASLADKVEAAFASSGTGHFYDAGVMSYCRQNTGFDTGVFGALGFAPTGDALALYEYCYNVNGDLTKASLGATNSRTGDVTCLALDASSGTVVRGEVTRTGPCVP